MQTIFFYKSSLLFSLIFFLLLPYDPNNDNDPATSCNTYFYALTTTETIRSHAYDIFKYRKSISFQRPIPVLSDFNLKTGNASLEFVKSTADLDRGIIVYQIAHALDLVEFDITTQTIVETTKNPMTDGFYPEYMNGNLFFLRIAPFTYDSHNDIGIAELTVKDLNANVIAFGSLDFSNSGFKFNLSASSTSNSIDKTYYLCNTSLLIYDNNTQNFSISQLEDFDAATNAVYYTGVEYVDDDTLYALRADIANNEVDLVKIDISSSPAAVKALTRLKDLSIQAADLVNNINFIKSGFDSCDNSYYFTYADTHNGGEPLIVEVKQGNYPLTEYTFSANQGNLIYSLEVF